MSKRVHLSTRTRAVALFLLCAAMTAGAFANFASSYAAAADGGASVTTDKTDYQPGETVVISGSGFAAGETVNITLKEDPARHADTSLTATADEYGNFFTKEFSPNEEHRGTTFNMTAVGQTSGRSAEYKFTDGNDYSYSVSPNPATFNVTSDASPHTVTAVVTVIAPDNGPGKPSASNVVTVAQQVIGGATPIPAAWLTITPATLTFNTSPQSSPWTVKVTVPAFAAAGTYSSTLKANPPAGKGGGGAGSTITVVVTSDNAPPNTTLAATTPPSVSYNGVNWTNQNVTIALSAVDTGTPASGVASTKYRVDGLPGDPYTTYSAPFTVSSGGLHVVTYFSIDNIGNTEAGKTFTVKIDKTKPVITLNGANPMSVGYGTGPFSDPGASAADAGGSGLNGAVSVSGSVNTNAAGDYALTYNVGDNAGNAADEVTRTVHVTKAEQTIDFAALGDKVFGDADFVVSATSGSGGAVTFTASGNCSVSGASVHITGAGACTVTAHQPGDSNYNAAPDVARSFNIAKAATTTAVTCAAGPFTYGGSAFEPCSVSVTGPGGLNLSPAPVYADNTNAGTATASYNYAGDDNYAASSDAENFTIDKASSTTAVTCPAGVTYDGTAQTPCSVSVTGPGGLSLTPAPSYADNTNAGTATASYAYAGDANHTASGDSKTFEIGKASSTTAVTCPASVTYNGAAQTPCTVSVSGVGGLNLTPAADYSNNVNAGTATAGYDFAGDANHEASSDSKTFEIGKANAVIVVTGFSGTYDGDPHGVVSSSATGVNSEPLSGLAIDPTTYTNVPGGSVHWTFSNANYADQSGDAAVVIGKAATTTVVTCGAGPFTYNGSAQTPCSASVSGPGGLSQPLTVGYADNTNAGTATASANYAGTGNYLSSSGSKNFTINKADQAINFGALANKFFGDAAFTVSATGGGSGNAVTFGSATPGVCSVTSAGTVTILAVGTCTVNANQAGNGNYNAAPQVQQSFTVGAWTLKGFYQPVDLGGVLNTVKGGSTVPLKFEIFAGATEKMSTSDVLGFSVKEIVCSNSTLVDDVELTTTGGTSLRYDMTAGQFVQNWQTPKTVGKCYLVTMTAKDNSSTSALFKTK